MPRAARDFARFVGRRYGARPVILVLGGDRNVETPEDFAITSAFAEGLKETAPKTLVTYHPRGPGRSSDVLHREPWLDFDMIQSSHTGRGSDNGGNVEHDRALDAGQADARRRAALRGADGRLLHARARTRRPLRRLRRPPRRPTAPCSPAPPGTRTATTTSGRCGRPAAQPLIGADTPWSEALDHPGRSRWATCAGCSSRGPWHPLDARRRTWSSARTRPADGFVRAAGASDRSFAFVLLAAGRAGERRPDAPRGARRLRVVVRPALRPRLLRAHRRRHRHPGLHAAVLGTRLRLGARAGRRRRRATRLPGRSGGRALLGSPLRLGRSGRRGARSPSLTAAGM